MTTAHNETSTERVPGRAWTVRLTGHSDRSATVTCSTRACRMPPRSKDLATLRTFAARHAAAHAKAATIRPNAWCHCGSQRCAAHPDKVHCAGAVVMILRHDPTQRCAWSVEEVCETCAPLIPHTTILARAGRPHRSNEQPVQQTSAPVRPGIPGGFSSAATSSAQGKPAPARRARRAPQQPRRRRSGQQR
ncbi:hypothetical protein [Streptomyces lydicus]|uniref:hypothetical protein n=1 Tax=Streptomyces lydicus TaxID=47763 RepID=UPI0010109C2B|nr:hypothetical protein [Streptomyces lydicus]MCZ1011968.1 hypothetical protein [Streptomyces lydicus]